MTSTTHRIAQVAFAVSVVPFALAGGALVAGVDILKSIGHEPDALPRVFGGRYLALGAILCVLAVLAEWRAIAVILAVGCAMAALDAVLVSNAGGPAWPHLAAGLFSLVGAVLALRIHRARQEA